LKPAGVQLGGWLPQSLVDSFVYSNTHGTFFPNVRKAFVKMHQERQEKGETVESSTDAHHKEKKIKKHHHKEAEEDVDQVTEAVAEVEVDGEHKKKKKKKHVEQSHNSSV
jgi:hypothetical protein